MALKAGRRGLNKRLVDAFGNLNGEAPSGDYYTKQQTDNKFETKTHVNNTFQKKTLEVPLEMLSGSKLTVEDALQGLNTEKFAYADNGVLGAKNLLYYPYFSSSSSFYTVNNDGTITMNGTASERVVFTFIHRTVPHNTPKGKYILSKGFSSTSIGQDVGIIVEAYNDDTWVKILATSVVTDEIEFDIDYNGYNKINVYLYASAGSYSNVIVKPMLRLASDPDDTYVPYAMTNRELTDKIIPYKTEFTNLKGTSSVNTIVKTGNIIVADLRTNGVTVEALESIATIPTGYRPANNVWFIANDMTGGALIRCSLNSDGSVNCPSAITDKEIYIHAFWSIV